MAHVLLIGREGALLEGLARSLAGAGHVPHVAADAHDAVPPSPRALPLVIVAERGVATEDTLALLRLPIATGGALLLYHTGDAPDVPPPASLQRAVMAELTLPLERHRLLALVNRIEERARLTGRGDRRDTPEPRAP
ncbi:MAG TPA: hypothetical protein VFK13_12500 [Gemmatimonadaceae bacterium]|nr:hypothetical protein [Gemmatimonadaceae bacterium]